jgi:glycosyltransferase involved in cell wall biosynthesis
MKILRVIRTLDPASGGMAEGIRQIAPNLRKHGVSTTVICLDPPGSDWLVNQGFDCYGLGPVAGEYGYRRGLPIRIHKHAQHHDIVIIDGIWHHHAFATWRALHKTSIPYFVYPHGMLDSWFKRTYPLKHLKKWLYWPWADYRVLRDARAVLFTSNQELISARESFWLYKAKEIVSGYGTSPPPINTASQLKLLFERFPQLQGKRIILFMGRIHPKKGVDILIEAFGQVANNENRLHLLIAGPDEVGLKTKLKQRADALGIAEHVTWAGMLDGVLKWGAFSCAELFCLPSHQENFGVAVAEALACGLPVAISAPVNISPEVLEASAGLVFHDDTISVKNCLLQWLAIRDTDRTKMGLNARRLFIDQFDMASVCIKLISILENHAK